MRSPSQMVGGQLRPQVSVSQMPSQGQLQMQTLETHVKTTLLSVITQMIPQIMGQVLAQIPTHN